jgi:MoaA/NifB/PqqE/SkfB family radical SAM enzyme
MSIYPGGGVTPCCFSHERQHDFGDISNSTVDEIWNNHHFRSARMLFDTNFPGENRLSVVCDACPMFHQKGKQARGALSVPVAQPIRLDPPRPRAPVAPPPEEGVGTP